MPNTPALVGRGAAAVARTGCATEADERLVVEMFSSVGRVVVVKEELMDAVTGLSGSGPAFACLVVEALADGGVKMGLP
ncbi:MAG: pyrroline-5-carboxylate reductase family protein, partial [Candidatus Geothermarchaeales archaeon]